MKLDGLPREKVLATIVSLLEKTLIRVGNAEYAEKNRSYGLTTMRRKHVEIGRGVLRFDFQLGNTPAICRKSYVHPEILSAYMPGELVKMLDAKIADKFKRQYAKLTSDEIMVLAFLHKRLKALKPAA
jgi:DNA topoisomerase IB